MTLADLTAEQRAILEEHTDDPEAALDTLTGAITDVFGQLSSGLWAFMEYAAANPHLWRQRKYRSIDDSWEI